MLKVLLQGFTVFTYTSMVKPPMGVYQQVWPRPDLSFHFFISWFSFLAVVLLVKFLSSVCSLDDIFKARSNPNNLTHGAPEDVVRHVGDLGNIVANADGGHETLFDHWKCWWDCGRLACGVVGLTPVSMRRLFCGSHVILSNICSLQLDMFNCLLSSVANVN